MLNSIKYLLSVFGLMLFASCGPDFFDQTIDIDPPEFEAQMVVNSIFNQEEDVLEMQVRRNIGLLDNFDAQGNKDLVAGAKIEILKEGADWVSFQQKNDPQDKGYFAPLPEAFESGKIYTMLVKHDSLPTMIAQQMMPASVDVDSVRYREKAGIDQYGDDLSEISVTFKDKAGVSNYYAMKILTNYVYYFDIYDADGNIIGQDSIIDSYPMYFERSDDANVTRGLGNYAVVRDDFFDGDGYRFTFKFFNYGYNNNGSFTVVFAAITEDVYLNLISRQRYADTADSPFSEPTTIYSNFDKGIGIFGLSSVKIFEIE